MTSLTCPNCDAPVPLQGGDDEWCEACGKRLPLAVVAAVHAAAKRMRQAAAAQAAGRDDDEKALTPATPAPAQRRSAVKRVAAWMTSLLGFLRRRGG
jgi:hypothetical protein